MDKIINEYLLGKITLNEVYLKFCEIIYLIVKEEVEHGPDI